MKPLQEFISENESARICGVSANTLGRFVETGYLQVEVDNDGLRYFAKDELKRVFGITDAQIPNKPTFDSDSGSNVAWKVDQFVDQMSDDAVVENIDTPEAATETAPEAKAPHLRVVREDEGDAVAGGLDDGLEGSLDDELAESLAGGTDSSPDAVMEVPEDQTGNIGVTVSTPLPFATPTAPTSPNAPTQPAANVAADNIDTRLLESEVTKLKNVVVLLEKILELREQELESVKKQSSWLQQRIERMEERSSREQILLLAESETVRRLISQQKRSPIRAALEWLGLADQSEHKGTIDHDKQS